MTKILVNRLVFDNRLRKWLHVGLVNIRASDVVSINQQRAFYEGLVFKIVFKTGAYIFTDNIGARTISQYV
jgi:hypothetical protein